MICDLFSLDVLQAATNFKGYLRTKGEYEAAIKTGKVVIDFSAAWCGPCKRIGPIYEKLAASFPGITFYKIDVDDNADAAEAENVQAMPTFKFYNGGVCNEDNTLQGAIEGKLKQRLEALTAE